MATTTRSPDPSRRCRQVAFKGIDILLEDQKTERGMQLRKAQRKNRQEAKKMAAAAAAADMAEIGYFLLFLQTYTVNERRGLMRENGLMMDALRRLFPDLIRDDDDDVDVGADDNDGNKRKLLQAFDDVVVNIRLPKVNNKRRQAQQASAMKEIIFLWEVYNLYDHRLDRFIQYLRVSLSEQQGTTLEGLLLILCDPNEAGRAREMASQLGRLVVAGEQHWMGVHARSMNDDMRRSLMNFIVVMKRNGELFGDSSDEEEETMLL